MARFSFGRICGLMLALGLGFGATATAQTDFTKQGAFSSAVFGPIDSRAIYGEGIFPEPLLAPEMDVERELRFDWIHQEKRGVVADEAKAEVEWSFGLLTVEVGFSYSRETAVEVDPFTATTARSRSEGLGNVEFAARYPLWQFVSADAQFEYTLVGALEVAVPTNTSVSKDTEIVPQVFQLMRFGKNVTFQTSVGYSALMGPEEGGTGTLEYSAVLGYSIDRSVLPVPGVTRIIPLAELVGDMPLTGD